jgi:hypothetical protein
MFRLELGARYLLCIFSTSKDDFSIKVKTMARLRISRRSIHNMYCYLINTMLYALSAALIRLGIMLLLRVEMRRFDTDRISVDGLIFRATR